MNFLAPISPSLVAKVAALSAALLIIAYILKMRRRSFEVPFSTLWQRVLKEKEATSLWRHLKRLLSLLLLLTMLAGLLLASLDPVTGGSREAARSIVFIVDTSASMKTLDAGDDGTQTRMAAAISKVDSYLASLRSDDAIMIMRMDGRATPLSRFHGDIPKHRKLLKALIASDTPADLHASLSAAADALRWRKNPLIVLVGDGAYSEESLANVSWKEQPFKEQSKQSPQISPQLKGATNTLLASVDLSGIEVRYAPVGHTGDNVGIISFNVRRYISNKLNYEVYIEVHNFGHEPATRRLVLYSGASEIDVRELHLAPGQTLARIYPDLGGGNESVLRARIESVANSQDDAFALDDEAWALIPESKRQKVLLVSEDNLYIEGALLIFDYIDVDKLSPSEYEKALDVGSLPPYDSVIYHAYTPDRVLPAPTHLLYFAPEGPHSPFKTIGTLERGRITFVSPTHPITRWLEMSDVNFDSLTGFRVDESLGEVALFKSIRTPIAAAKKEGRRKVAAFGFGLKGTDIMLRVAFPLLMVNTLDWFAGSDSDLITTYATGHTIRVPLDGTYGVSEAVVSDPSGKTHKAPIRDGYASFFADTVGVHTLVASKEGQEVARIVLACNLSNPTESDIEPSTKLLLGGQELAAPAFVASPVRQSLWTYLCFMVLLLLIVEWYTFNRRITV